MIKKLFSKRSGFTLVEIVVAFAVFAIMAAMISQLLMMVVSQRQSNKDFQDELNDQEAKIIADGKNTDYDKTKAAEGKIGLNFGADCDYSIDYQIKSADGTVGDGTGLNYFVGNVNYGADGTVTPPGSDTPTQPGSKNNGASQAAAYDTRITGTKGMDSVNIYYATKDADQSGLSGDQVRYIFHVAASTTNVAKDDVPYEQIRLYFYTDQSTQIDGVDSKGNSYKKTVYNAANIVEAGYVNGADQTNSSGNREKFKGGFSSSTGTNPYKVELMGSNCIRISAGKKDNPIGVTAAKFYVVFEKDPYAHTAADKIAASFGKNAVAGSTGYSYGPCPIYDETTGEATAKKHANIYGAYPWQKTYT